MALSLWWRGGPGSVPGRGIKVPQATHSSQKKERKKAHKLEIRKFLTIKLLWEMQKVTIPFFTRKKMRSLS